MQKEGRRLIYSKAATEQMDDEVSDSLLIWGISRHEPEVK